VLTGLILLYYNFFFQAEDGIRDRNVTGVQTCALPISIIFLVSIIISPLNYLDLLIAFTGHTWAHTLHPTQTSGSIEDFNLSIPRSEERRVGKESSCHGDQHIGKKKEYSREVVVDVTA